MGGMSTIKAVVVLTSCALAYNEASDAVLAMASNQSIAVDLHKLRHHFDRSQQEHASSMNAIMQSMTSHSALEILRRNKKASPELLAFAQTAVSHSHLRASSRAPITPPKGYAAVDGAKYMLNKLLEETMSKYDMEILKCRDYYTTQCGQIEASRGSIAASNFKVAECRTKILAAESQIGTGETMIPPAKQALSDHRAKCKSDVSLLHKKLNKLQGDIGVMTSILQMTDCGKSFIQTARHVGKGVGVLHCKHHRCDHVSLVSFDHSPLKSHCEQVHYARSPENSRSSPLASRRSLV